MDIAPDERGKAYNRLFQFARSLGIESLGEHNSEDRDLRLAQYLTNIEERILSLERIVDKLVEANK